MKIRKIKTHELEKCYSICPLTYHGSEHMLVAAEKVNKCLLFDLDGNLEETVWEGPGGTMTMVQLPGSDGQFLATHKFYSPNDSKEAKIVLATPKGKDDWEIKTLVDLPFVHRFDILTSGGVHYLIACALKSGHEYKEDWTNPGKIWVCELSEDLSAVDEEHPLKLTALKEGLLKNHGYCRVEEDGGVWAAVAADNGIFKVTPPARRGGDWTVETLAEDAASDMTFADFDGDGEKEMLVMAPFHGDVIKIYKKKDGVYTCIKTFEEKYEFAHGIWGTEIDGKGVAIIGHRKGNRNLLACTYDGSDYVMEVLDEDVGPANVRCYPKGEKVGLVSTNREIDEIAFYEIESL